MQEGGEGENRADRSARLNKITTSDGVAQQVKQRLLEPFIVGSGGCGNEGGFSPCKPFHDGSTYGCSPP